MAITRVVAVSTIMGGLVFQGAVIAMPKLFEEGLGSLADSILGVGLLVSLVIGISAFGKIIVGHLIDRMRIKYVWIGMLFVQVPLLAVIGMTSEAGMLIVTFVAMLMIIGEVPIADTLVARHTDDAWRSRIYGVKFLFGLSASALAVPLVAFLHGSGGGFIWLFLILAAMALVIGIAVFWLPGSARPSSAALSETPQAL
ncbi:MAG: MFS transporter [Proteobacteria bacterium]|nr:MFS transporter [Pseudomonadota bacterium]MDA1357865.1 MFS transporter [Pseudomonadota bacterium]